MFEKIHFSKIGKIKEKFVEKCSISIITIKPKVERLREGEEKKHFCKRRNSP